MRCDIGENRIRYIIGVVILRVMRRQGRGLCLCVEQKTCIQVGRLDNDQNNPLYFMLTTSEWPTTK